MSAKKEVRQDGCESREQHSSCAGAACRSSATGVAGVEVADPELLPAAEPPLGPPGPGAGFETGRVAAAESSSTLPLTTPPRAAVPDV
jgi:hypothetical protein